MTSKTSTIRVSFSFRKLSDAALLARSIAVHTGMTGTANFPNPTVDPNVLKTANDNFALAMSATLDGGSKAIAERNKQREALIKMLRQLAIYVEANCND